MGVKGLGAVIDKTLQSICGPVVSVQGRLVIDGGNLLHELYREHHLDWANGGCYPKLHEVTVEFFRNLQSAGVQPIVVIDGAGVESDLQDVFYRRNRSIGDIPECIKKAHASQDSHRETRHFLPMLSRVMFVKAVKEVSGVSLFYADGRANTTAVKLANHYGCPVLGDDTNYCVFDVRGGIILYKYFNTGSGSCTAHIIQRGRLFQGHFKLNDLSLVFAMVGILGDGGDKSIPGLYYGRSDLQRMIANQPGVEGRRNWPLNVSQFLCKFRNLEHFKREISTFRLEASIKSQLSSNCVKAEKQYTVSSTLSCEAIQENSTIQCSYPCQVPSPLLRQFRNGDLPNFIMDVIALGKTCLCQQVGDVKQAPVVTLGRPIREAAYGFASGLMDRHSSRSITEYHRNAVGAQQKLSYSAHEVNPTCSTRELMVTNIGQLSEESRISLAKQTICAIFGCNWEEISVFDNDEERSWTIIVALTQFWARHQLRNRLLPNADLVIRSLVYSFVRCSSRAQGEDYQQPQPHHLPDTFRDPNWIRVYHAALEWQCLYADTVGLNACLLYTSPSPRDATLSRMPSSA